MENLNYKNENIERKYLKNVQKNKFLKVKNNLLELNKDFYRTERQKIETQKSKN